jgi:uncharacterized membrane protein YkoI
MLGVLALLSLGIGDVESACALSSARAHREHGSVLVVHGAATSASAAQLPNRRELTLGEAIVMAQKRHPGFVVFSQTIYLGNGSVHEIRIIGADGRVHIVRIDARTGTVQ